MNKLYILCGIPFSGKTTLTKAISNRFGYPTIDLDEIKFDLFGRQICDDDLLKKDWGRVFREIYRRIKILLKEGKTIIYDTGNFTRKERDLVRQIANKLNIKIITIFVDTPKEIAYQRLLINRKSQERFNVSDQDFEDTVKEMQPPASDENFLVFTPDTNIDEFLSKL